jgi:hypothetical protein
MNRNYNKIRHMQNSNLILERRYLVEQTVSTPPTNSLQTLNSLVPGSMLQGVFGAGDEDTEQSGTFTDVNDRTKKVRLDFSDFGGGNFKASSFNLSAQNKINVFNQSQLESSFDNPDGIKIAPNSNFVTFTPFGQDIPTIYINDQNVVSYGKLRNKNTVAGK